MLIAARQGLTLRSQLNPKQTLSPALQAFQIKLEKLIPPVVEDRALDQDLHTLLQAQHSTEWHLYEKT
jgi:histidine ammonia-lyase